MPLPLFGFLARGVYLVPLLQFLVRLRHCGTFKVFTPYPKDLGDFPAVSLVRNQATLAYLFARHEHYRHHSLCEHGLSSTVKTVAVTQSLLMSAKYSIAKYEDDCNWYYLLFVQFTAKHMFF